VTTRNTDSPRLALVLGILAVALACGSCGKEIGAIEATVVGYTGAHELGLVEVRLRTLYDLETLDGQVSRFKGGARIVLDWDELTRWEQRYEATGEPPDDAELVAMTVRDGGEPVHLAWIERDGVVVPADYDSLAMLTAYYHMERTWLWLSEMGIPEARLDPLTTYYAPDLVDELDTLLHLPLLDNAAYFLPARAFLILGVQDQDHAPVPANPGIIVHEYGHAVFQALVFGGQGGYVASLQTADLLAAFNEGTADYLAAARTQDPNFLALSFPEEEPYRDLSVRREFNPLMLDSAGDPAVAYDPYVLGAVWASALWTIGEDNGHDWTVRQLLGALRALGDHLDGFGVTTLPDLLASRAGRNAERVCGVLRTRFAEAEWPWDSSCLGPEAGPPGGGQP